MFQRSHHNEPKEDKKLEEIINDALDEAFESLTEEEAEQEFKEFEKMVSTHANVNLKTEDVIELFRDNKKILKILNGIDKQYITADLISAIFNYGTNQNTAISKITTLTEALDDLKKVVRKFWLYLLFASIGSIVFGYTMAVYQHHNIKPFFSEMAKEVVKKAIKLAD